MKKYWIQIGILMCGVLLGILLGSAQSNKLASPAPPPSALTGGEKSVWLMIEEGAGSEAWKIEPEKGESLLNTMERLGEEEKLEMKAREFSGLGVMIEELEGKKNGDKGKYWQYWVNETYAKVGAGAYIPQGGDIIEWRFTNQQNF